MHDIYERIRITQLHKPSQVVTPKLPPLPVLAPGEEYRELLGTIEMTVKQWFVVPDNPLQRDTEKRFARATHLDTFKPPQRLVIMAILPNGDLYKVDGHTRVLKWVTPGFPNPPTHVEVKRYLCRDIEAVMGLHKCYDNIKAADTANDKMFGAMRVNEIVFQSSFMKALKYHSSLVELDNFTFGYHGDELEVVVDRYRPALLLLDTITPTHKKFPTGIVMASLGTLLADGQKALKFWEKYHKRDGYKADGKMDAVQSLLEMMDAEERTNAKARYGQTFRKAVSFYLGYRAAARYSTRNRNTAPKDDETIRKFLRSNLAAGLVKAG